MKKQDAFTLLETLIALTMMAILLTALATIMAQSIFWVGYHRAEFQALQLSEEALEGLEWMIHQNEAQNYTWHDGSALWGQPLLGAEESTKILALESSACPVCYKMSDKKEVKEGYERELELSWKQENLMQVRSRVRYSYRGKEYTVELESFMTQSPL